jgi:hypothetical protein
MVHIDPSSAFTKASRGSLVPLALVLAAMLPAMAASVRRGMLINEMTVRDRGSPRLSR